LVALGEVVAGDPKELARRHVEDDGAGVGKLLDGADPKAGVDLAAEGEQVRPQGVGDLLRPAPGERPADGVA
jgi:hypothetical protein